MVCFSTFVQLLDVFLSFMKMNWYGAAECCVLHMGCFYVLTCCSFVAQEISVASGVCLLLLGLGFVLNHFFEAFRLRFFCLVVVDDKTVC